MRLSKIGAAKNCFFKATLRRAAGQALGRRPTSGFDAARW